MSASVVSLVHLTILTGHARRSPRSEVADHVIASLQVIIAQGGGVLGNTGWALLIVERSADGAIYHISHRGVEVARCLAVTAADEARLWGEARGFPTLPGVRPGKAGELTVARCGAVTRWHGVAG